MEKVFMERRLEKNIPIWEWEGVKLIRVGKATYVTVLPVASNVRRLSDAKNIAQEFAEQHNCQATVTYDTEWLEVCAFLKTNFAAKDFIAMNGLDNYEALLLDSLSGGEKHVLAAGYNHRLNEVFNGFISGEDSDGEPQAPKLLFLTIRHNLT